MTALWLPPSSRTYRAPKVSREHWEQMLAWEAKVEAVMRWHSPILDAWTRELRTLDSLLCLAKASLTADVAGIMPGFYHLVRRRDPATATFMMVTLLHVDGKFVEPSDAMLRGLRAADLQNPRAVQDRMRRDIEAARSAANEERRDDEDRRDQLRDGLNAITRTQVLVSDDVPWSQNNSAAARRARGEKRKGRS